MPTTNVITPSEDGGLIRYSVKDGISSYFGPSYRREVLKAAIEKGKITHPGTYVVTQHNDLDISVQSFEVEEVPIPRFRIKD